MITIDAVFLMVNLFAYGMREIRLCQLKELVSLIYKDMPGDFYINITTDNIYSVLQSNKDVFAEVSTGERGWRIIRGWRQDVQTHLQDTITAAISSSGLSTGEIEQVITAYTQILQEENVKAVLNKITFEDPFAKEYVEDIYNWRIKEPYRTRLKEIIAEYAETQLSSKEKAIKPSI